MSSSLYLDFLYQFEPDVTPSWIAFDGNPVGYQHTQLVYELVRMIYSERLGGTHVSYSTQRRINVLNVVTNTIDVQPAHDKTVNFSGLVPEYIKRKYRRLLDTDHFDLNITLPAYMFSEHQSSLNQLYHPLDPSVMRLSYDQYKHILLGTHRVLFPVGTELQIVRHSAYYSRETTATHMYGSWVFTPEYVCEVVSLYERTPKKIPFLHSSVSTTQPVKLSDLVLFDTRLPKIPVDGDYKPMHVPFLSVCVADTMNLMTQTFCSARFQSFKQVSDLCPEVEYVGGKVVAISPKSADGRRIHVLNPAYSVFNDFLILSNDYDILTDTKFGDIDEQLIGLGQSDRVGKLYVQDLTRALPPTQTVGADKPYIDARVTGVTMNNSTESNLVATVSIKPIPPVATINLSNVKKSSPFDGRGDE